MSQSGRGSPTLVQVIVQQPRGNSAATIALLCVALGVLTCCLPIVPWIFAVLGMAFSLLGIIIALTRGGAGLLYSLFALVMSFLPLLPIFLVGGLLGSRAIERAQEAAQKSQREYEAREGARIAAESVAQPGGPAAPLVATSTSESATGPAAAPIAEVAAKEALEKRAAKPLVERREPEPVPGPVEPPASRTRTWQDASGRFSIEAEYKGTLGGKVILEKADGTRTQIPLDRLSDEDRAWIEGLKAKR